MHLSGRRRWNGGIKSYHQGQQMKGQDSLIFCSGTQNEVSVVKGGHLSKSLLR